MNPERLICLPNGELEPKQLYDAGWNLANRISGGQWRQPTTRKTSISRGLVESLSFLTEHRYDQDYDTPDNGTIVDFQAMRVAPDAERYSISYHRADYITPSILSLPLLKRIIKENNGSKKADSDIMEGVSVSELKSDDETSLGLVKEDKYIFDEDGDIISLDIVNRYVMNDTVLIADSFKYNWGRRSDWIAIGGQSNERSPEGHKDNLSKLKATHIEQAARLDLSEEWRRFRDIGENYGPEVFVAGYDLSEHTRRAIALIALAGQGLVTMKQLLKEAPRES